MDTQKPAKNIAQRHPIIFTVVGLFLVTSIVSAFDSGMPVPTPTSIPTLIIRHIIAPTPKVKITPSPVATRVPQQNCHSSYSGCLKADASDYDCAGGSGNGPYYTGTVRVIGLDVFDLDRDNDGLGCE